MHMTSQKGAQLRWGSNETLPRASSPSMQPGGQTLQATPPGWPARARALRGWVPMRSCQHNTCALRDTRLASLLWRCDPLWRQCIRSIQTGCHNGVQVYISYNRNTRLVIKSKMSHFVAQLGGMTQIHTLYTCIHVYMCNANCQNATCKCMRVCWELISCHIVYSWRSVHLNCVHFNNCHSISFNQQQRLHL